MKTTLKELEQPIPRSGSLPSSRYARFAALMILGNGFPGRALLACPARTAVAGLRDLNPVGIPEGNDPTRLFRRVLLQKLFAQIGEESSGLRSPRRPAVDRLPSTAGFVNEINRGVARTAETLSVSAQ